jgi:phosphoserine phosphatase RsbU/P
MFSEEKIKLLLRVIIYLISSVSIFAFFELFQINIRDGRVTDENRFQSVDGEIRVISVTKGGASDRAGMLAGDIILEIDEIQFKDQLEADEYLRSRKAGDLLTYTVKRDTQILQLMVVAARQSISFYHFLGVVLFLMYAALSIYLATKKEIKIIGLVFAIGALCMAIICSVAIIAFSNGILTPLLTFLLVIAVSFGNATFLHSHFYLSNKVDISNRKKLKLIIRLNYIISIILFFTFMYMLIEADSFLLTSLRTMPSLMIFLMPIASIINFSLVIYFHVLYLDKVKHISIVTFLIWIYFTFSLFVGGFLFAKGLEEAILLFIPIVFQPLVYAFLISKNNSFGIIQVLKQNVQYRFSYAAIWFLIVILFYTFIKLLSQVDLGSTGIILGYNSIELGDASQPGFTERPIFILSGFFSFFILIATKKQIGKILSRMFNRQEYDYKKAFNEISALIATTENLSDLYEKVLIDLLHFMNLKSLVLYTKNHKQFELQNHVGLTKHEITSLKHFIKTDDFKYEEQVPIDIVKSLFTDRVGSLQFAIPMKIKNDILGVLLLGEKKSEDNFNKTDFEFFEAFNRQFLVAIENMRLQKDKLKSDFLNREIKLAKEIQVNLMPKEIPDIKDLEITGFYKAANYVGGDYYDFLYDKSIDNDILIVLGDVSGKGVSASLYMSRFQGVMRSFYYAGRRKPKELIESTNGMVCSDIAKNSFVTCICVSLNPEKKVAKIVRAGHLPLLKYTAKDKKIIQISPQGLGLGLSNSDVFRKTLQEFEENYDKGDIFLLYSDGITEAMNPKNDEFGFDRLEKCVYEVVDKTAVEIKEHIMKNIEEFIKTDISNDDITFVIVKVC